MNTRQKVNCFFGFWAIILFAPVIMLNYRIRVWFPKFHNYLGKSKLSKSFYHTFGLAVNWPEA